MSGVKVASTTRSMSAGLTPALSMARTAASWHRSLVAWCGRAWRRSRMPVRLTIQSESKPKRSCRCSLVTTASGT